MLRDARNEHATWSEHSVDLTQNEFIFLYMLENVERPYQFKRFRKESPSGVHLDKLDIVSMPVQCIEQSAAMEFAACDVGPWQSRPEGLEHKARAAANLDGATGC
jgi:hypothetical protein